MANDFYNHANFPGTRAALSSSAMSAELESVQQGSTSWRRYRATVGISCA